MNFTKYAEKGNQYLDEIANLLGFPGNRKLAARILRSTLHTLRDKLTIEESIHLIAQLPFVIKAMYVENWKYRSEPLPIDSIQEFIREIVHDDPVGHHDFQTAKDGENAVMAVFKIIRNHVSEGEIKKVLEKLPDKIHPLWGSKVGMVN